MIFQDLTDYISMIHSMPLVGNIHSRNYSLDVFNTKITQTELQNKIAIRKLKYKMFEFHKWGLDKVSPYPP